MKVKLSNVLILISTIFLISGCVNVQKKVEEILINDLTNTVNVDNDTIDRLISGTVEVQKDTTAEKTEPSEENEKVFEKIVIEMAKNLKYNIISVEKSENKEDKKVIATVELTNKNIDSLTDEFFQNIADDMAFGYMLGEKIDPNSMILKAYENLLESYKKIDPKNTVTKTIKIEYKEIEKGKWEMINRDEYTNAILGNLFTKISFKQEKTLPKLSADALLKSIKAIKPEQVAKLFGTEETEGDTDIIKTITTHIFNNIEYKFLNEEIDGEKTHVIYEIKTIDAKKVIATYEERFTSYFKEKIESRKIPDDSQLVKDIFSLITDIVVQDNTEKITDQIKITFNKKYQIVNGDDFINKILNGFWVEMDNAGDKLQENITKLLK